MENEKGYKNSFNYNQYGIEIKGYSTTSEHAKEYGIYALNPFYLQHLFVNEPDRNKGKGKQALEIIDNYAREKKYDVIFGYISEKAVFTKNKESFFNDADLIKYWLHNNGYAVNNETNEFHKKMTEIAEPIDVFYNPDIFVEEKDYIIGGFTIGELKGVRVVGDNSELGETKLYRVFKDRIISHIEEFKASIKGDTPAYPKSDRINDDLSNIFESVDIHLNSNNIEGDGTYDNEYLADEIMQHPAYVLWRSRITNRVNNNYRTAVPIPLISDKPNKISSADAEELTKNITLHHILEQLSNIIENEDGE